MIGDEKLRAFCEDYCRYPNEYNEDEEGRTLEDAICVDCPSNWFETLCKRLDSLTSFYELKIQSLTELMPDYENRGLGPYKKHELRRFTEFVDNLKKARGE